MPTSTDSREGLIMFSVALATFMARLDSYIVNVSLPTIARYFDASLFEISRVIFIYVLTASSTLLIFGKLADRMGLRTFFVGGYLVFTGGSFLCGISTGIDMLTGSRFVQGLGSSMLAATSLAVISRHIPPEKVGRALAVFTSASALGISLGAPLGGFITDFVSWHWIFLINVPIGIAAIIVAARVIPRENPPKHDAAAPPFDIPGAILSLMAMSLSLVAMNKGQECGRLSIGMISGFILSGLCAGAFIAREKKCAWPLVDISLFRSRRFYLPLLANFIIYMTIAAHNFLMPFYLDLIKHMTPSHIGLFLMIYSVGFVIVPPAAGRFTDSMDPVLVTTFAMAVTACSFFFFSFTLHFEGLLFVVGFFVIRAVGNGIFVPPNNRLIMESASEENKGSVSGILNTVTFLGATIGVVFSEAMFSEIIHQSGTDHTFAGSGFSADTLYSGFRSVFAALGIVGIIGTIASYLTGDPQRKGKETLT